jgi:UDP:flavonoid glycosyltransferase YjiC (YdhE family)
VISLSPSSPTADIAAALRRLLDDASHERDAARRLKAAFAAYDGPGLVVAALEKLAVPAVSSGVA